MSRIVVEYTDGTSRKFRDMASAFEAMTPEQQAQVRGKYQHQFGAQTAREQRAMDTIRERMGRARSSTLGARLSR